MVEVVAHNAMYAARLTMIGYKRQLVGCGELIIGNTECVESKLVLHEVDEAHSVVLCLVESRCTLLGSHFYEVHIVVVALDGPVDHIFVVWQLAVGNHHVATPHAVGFFRVDAELVGTAAGKFGAVVTLGARNCHVAVIVLENCHVGDVLNDVVCLLGRNVLVCHLAAFHTHVIFHSAQFCHVAKFGSINHHAGFHHAVGLSFGRNSCVPHTAVAVEAL